MTGLPSSKGLLNTSTEPDDWPKLFRRNSEVVAVFVGELDVPFAEAISEMKDVGYIAFAKPKDHGKQRL